MWRRVINNNIVITSVNNSIAWRNTIARMYLFRISGRWPFQDVQTSTATHAVCHAELTGSFFFHLGLLEALHHLASARTSGRKQRDPGSSRTPLVHPRVKFGVNTYIKYAHEARHSVVGTSDRLQPSVDFWCPVFSTETTSYCARSTRAIHVGRITDAAQDFDCHGVSGWPLRVLKIEHVQKLLCYFFILLNYPDCIAVVSITRTQRTSHSSHLHEWSRSNLCI